MWDKRSAAIAIAGSCRSVLHARMYEKGRWIGWKLKVFTRKFVLSGSDNRNFGKSETNQISKLRKDGDDYGLAYRNTERNQLCRGALTEEIDSKEAVKEAACSNFYFQRIFSILCGISLGDSCS